MDPRLDIYKSISNFRTISVIVEQAALAKKLLKEKLEEKMTALG